MVIKNSKVVHLYIREIERERRGGGTENLDGKEIRNVCFLAAFVRIPVGKRHAIHRNDHILKKRLHCAKMITVRISIISYISYF